MSALENDIQAVIEAILSQEAVTGAQVTAYLFSTGLNRSQQSALMGISAKQLRELEKGRAMPSQRTVANVRYLIAHPEEIEFVRGKPSKLIGSVLVQTPKHIPLDAIPAKTGYWGYCVAANCRKPVYFTNNKQKYCSKRCSSAVDQGRTYAIGRIERPPRDATYRATIVRCPKCRHEFELKGNKIGYGQSPAQRKADHDAEVQVERKEPGVPDDLLRQSTGSVQSNFDVRVVSSDTGSGVIHLTGSEDSGTVAIYETGRFEHPEGGGGCPDSPGSEN